MYINIILGKVKVEGMNTVETTNFADLVEGNKTMLIN